MHLDDPGHGSVIESARLGQGWPQQAELFGSDLDTLADALAEPANLADRIPVLLTLAAHPTERRPVDLTQAGSAQTGPADFLTVTCRSPCYFSPDTSPDPRRPLPHYYYGGSTVWVSEPVLAVKAVSPA